MDIEEKKLDLELLKTFFFKSFLISFILLLVSWGLCVSMHNYQTTIVMKYFPISTEHLNYLILLSFAVWKIIIFQFTLIPALVLWGMQHCSKCAINKK